MLNSAVKRWVSACCATIAASSGRGRIRRRKAHGAGRRTAPCRRRRCRPGAAGGGDQDGHGLFRVGRQVAAQGPRQVAPGHQFEFVRSRPGASAKRRRRKAGMDGGDGLGKAYCDGRAREMVLRVPRQNDSTARREKMKRAFFPGMGFNESRTARPSSGNPLARSGPAPASRPNPGRRSAMTFAMLLVSALLSWDRRARPAPPQGTRGGGPGRRSHRRVFAASGSSPSNRPATPPGHRGGALSARQGADAAPAGLFAGDLPLPLFPTIPTGADYRRNPYDRGVCMPPPVGDDRRRGGDRRGAV